MRVAPRYLVPVVGCCVLATALTACSNSRDTSSGSNSPSGPWTIGVLNANTGSLGVVGQQEQQGMNLAVSQINAAGGVDGHKLKLTTVDEQGSVSLSTAGLKKLATSNKVPVVIGPGITADAAADAPLAAQYGVTEILLVASASIVKGSTNAFEVPPPESTNSQAMVNYAKENGISKAAIIWASNPYGQEGNAEITDAAKKAGIAITSSDSWDPSKFNFSAQASKVASSNPPAVFLYGAGGSSDGLLLKAVRDAGYKGTVIGDLTYASSTIPKTAGSAATGVVALTSVNYVSPSASDKKFLDAFQARYKSVPTGLSANGYVGVELAAKALAKAGSTDGNAVANAMESVKYASVVGTYDFSSSYHAGPTDPSAFKPVSFDNSGKYVAPSQ